MNYSSMNLFTTYYYEPDIKRNKELKDAIIININCEYFSKVYIFNESGNVSFISTEKVVVIPVLKRPNYQDFYRFILSSAFENQINIIANTDIFFDHNIDALRSINLDDTCLALSRWDIQPDGSAKLFNRNDSQDVWIFKGKVKEKVFGDFPVGVPFCDNRIMYELQKAGYKVFNPSFSIKAYHLHAGKREEYNKEKLTLYVDPPYRYLYPHNLYNLPRTLWFNLTHKNKLAPYRYDLKKINRWFIIKVVRRLWEVTTGREFPLIGYKL